MITALLVTYGNRWHLLKRVLVRLSELEKLSEIIIVDNNSECKSEISNFKSGKKFKHIITEQNIGSAGAFKKGLTHFVSNSENNLVWLLDDDNLPDEDALDKLILSYNELSDSRNLIALLSLRKDRSYLVKTSKGERLEKLFPTQDSYLGFNLFNSFTKSYSKSKLYAHVNLPMAPYGGLLLFKDLIAKIGMPMEDLFLYVDDFEYTHRIHRLGGNIFLVNESVITDLEKSWVTSQKKLFKPRMLFQDDFRSRYSIRNSVYFSKHILRKNVFVYTINKYVTTFYFLISSLIHLKPSLFAKYLKLAKEGERFIPTK